MVSMEENIRPPFSSEDALHLLETQYKLQAQSIKELSAELDRNFYIKGWDDREYILKIAHSSAADSVLDLQNATLKHVAQSLDIFPQIQLTCTQQDMAKVNGDDGQQYTVRLLNYLTGIPLVDFRPHTPELLGDIGTQLGQLSTAMQGFEHSEKRLDYRWNSLNVYDVIPYMEGMPSEKQTLIDYFVNSYETVVVPNLDTVRYSFIHNDANDHNILVQAQMIDKATVSGIIDFGDMVYSLTIAELAVSLAYVMMYKDQPLDAAVQVVRSFHQAFPLTESEIMMLYPLVTARLCMSVCISWYQQQREPDNLHLSISEDGAWQLLYRLRNIHPRLAEYVFRDACGFEANPQTTAIITWLSQQSFHPIMDKAITADNSVILDLSIGSTDLGNVDEFSDTPLFTHQIFSQLATGQIAIGRYNEARPIYLGDMFAVSLHERRTIHIGLDLFDHAGTPIFAPLDGRVYSAYENQGDKDYGPTLILEHQPTPDITFYTLYGHLDASVLTHLTVGQSVKAGDQIALIGDYPRNGNWPPHVHFQIITDMLGNTHEFSGVALPRYRDVWLSLSPDPNLILRLGEETKAGNTSNHQAIIATRQQYLNPAMSMSYNQPIKIK